MKAVPKTISAVPHQGTLHAVDRAPQLSGQPVAELGDAANLLHVLNDGLEALERLLGDEDDDRLPRAVISGLRALAFQGARDAEQAIAEISA